MKKIVSIIGARPQFIKAAAVSRALKENMLHEVLVHTGQHFDQNMSQVFFEQMQIAPPDYNLGIHGLGHGAMTGRMLEAIEEVLMAEKPDVVLVYGDTNSTLAGALAAAKLHIPLAHVEAGLRSFNRLMPEEINRILTDRLSQWLFCPTITSMNNLKAEGFESFDCQMHLCGDVMYDASLLFAPMSRPPAGLETGGDFLLCTLHRAENTDNRERLASIIEAINQLSQNMQVVFPVHPRTARLLGRDGLPGLAPGVIRLQPVGYLESLWLLRHARMLATDSGGMQKEAYFFGLPCLTLRDETEWVELVDAGCNILCGAEKNRILQAYSHFIYQKPAFPPGLYGKGNAGQIIARHLYDS